MHRLRHSLIWLAIGGAGALLVAWAYPRVTELLPGEWTVTRGEAEAIALERLRDLGEPVADAYVVTRLVTEPQIERRMQLRVAGGADPEELRESWIAAEQVHWEVLVYPPGASPRRWRQRAQLTLGGEVRSLWNRPPSDEDREFEALEPVEMRRLAEAYFAEVGLDFSEYTGEFDVEQREIGDGVASMARFERRSRRLGDDFPYGTAVIFEAGRPTGFGPWFEDPDEEVYRSEGRGRQLTFWLRTVLLYILLPLAAIAFLKQYHDGQLGVRRGVQIFLVCMGLGILFMILNSRNLSEGTSFGFITRQQTSWLVVGMGTIFQLFGLAVLALMSWSLGELLCRRRWPQKLASLDALFRLDWKNATVARASLRGLTGGLAMAGVLLTLAWLATVLADARFLTSFFWMGSGFDGKLPWVAPVAGVAGFQIPLLLFSCLLLPNWLRLRLSRNVSLVLSVLMLALAMPILLLQPMAWGWAVWVPVAAIPVFLVFFGDVLAAVLAGLTSMTVLAVLPALGAGDPALQLAAAANLLLVSAPLLLSARHLGSEREFAYVWDDVPPHVRRIAERERQRVELETARNIQGSILPELPPQLHGVEIAHSYLPATEVGGDFYDVLSLDDGRLAVAVGDVAGHGVSSGLVMSMAKSALAVQVTFEPAVEAVFHTLNRMVYQSARRRLLSTLCYAILDPHRRELYYASAGHVFPYRVSAEGDVEALEECSYPLGVRGEIMVRERTTRLEPGDAIFMYSDGLVEACAEEDDEPFGFDRLEGSLRQHAGKSPGEMRNGVLQDVAAYTRTQHREDDLTVLVLRLPAA